MVKENSDEVLGSSEEQSIRNWSKDFYYNKMSTSSAELYPRPRVLWKAELKSNELEFLIGDMSKQQSNQSAMWFLLTIKYKREIIFKTEFVTKGEIYLGFEKSSAYPCKE